MKIVLKNLERAIEILLIVILILMGYISEFNIVGVRAEEKLDNNEIISRDEDLENFMNNYFQEKMEEYSVPGAAVVVVKDNKEIFKRGYGYRNLQLKTKVDPDKTSFPACSVSKLFTATAIMQLYEDGKIDLDKDINYYISPYKVINKFHRPVTCRNLLTHSSGVDEESELNGTTIDENCIKSQEYYMDTHTPTVVTEPDTICRYSNEGYNLLGYIVEKVSGVSYEKYVKENILKLLNMNNSSIRLKDSDTAIGYTYDGEKYNENPLAYQYTSGSAGIITTVNDMENFIIANLNNGKFEDINLLNSETMESMHSRQFSNSDALPGMGFGFIRSYRNGKEIIKHEGALPSGFTTTLFLIPEDNLGIYIATNSLSALPFNFEEEFLNYFYPYSSDDFSNAERTLNKDYKKYEGIYRSYDGTSKNNIMKLNVLFDPSMDMEIKDNKDGTLTLHEFTEAKEEITTKLIEINDDIFLREDGRGKFVFRTDEEGNITYAFNDVSENSFEKINFYEEREFIIGALSIIIVIFILNEVLSAVSFIKRKKSKDIKLEKAKNMKIIKILNLIIEIFNCIGLLGAVIFTVVMVINNDFSLKYVLYFFLTLLIISTIMAIFSMILFGLYMIKKSGAIKNKIYYIILNMSNLLFIIFLYYFNFLGYKI